MIQHEKWYVDWSSRRLLNGVTHGWMVRRGETYDEMETVCEIPDDLDPEERARIARLIAAAPALLAACINLVDYVVGLELDATLPATEATEACAEARAAIRKATGGE